MSPDSRIAPSEPISRSGDCRSYLAFGRVEPCVREDCVFFRVPGVDGCAVETWVPDVQADQCAAAWFLSRRFEAEKARTARDARFGLERGHRHPEIS